MQFENVFVGYIKYNRENITSKKPTGLFFWLFATETADEF